MRQLILKTIFSVCLILFSPLRTFAVESKPADRLEVPEVFRLALSEKSSDSKLTSPKLEAGTAVLKGLIVGYQPEADLQILISLVNPVTCNLEEYKPLVLTDGRFEMAIPMVCPMQVTMTSSLFNGSILLSPGKESSICMDLQQVDKSTRWIYYQGANAEINNQLGIGQSFGFSKNQDQILKDIPGMTSIQYKTYILGLYQEAVSSLKSKNLSTNAFELETLNLQQQAINYLLSVNHYLEAAYKKAVEQNFSGVSYVKPDITIDYYSFLKDLRINDPIFLYQAEYGYLIHSMSYLNVNSTKSNLNDITKAIAQELIDSGKLTAEGRECANYLKSNPSILKEIINASDDKTQEVSLAPSFRKKVEAFIEKYKTQIMESIRNRAADDSRNYLADILGTDQGLFFDMMLAQEICSGFRDYLQLNEKSYRHLSTIRDPFFAPYIKARNQDLLFEMEANKKKRGYTVYEVPEISNDKLFAKLMEPFAGKVILVDFWATWCSPCRSANKEMGAVADSLKNMEVAFVHLTDESSPLKTWENMIPDIRGEHYRLSNEDFAFLKQQFGVTGIPFYLIFNKKGEQTYFQTGFTKAEEFAVRLKAELNN